MAVFLLQETIQVADTFLLLLQERETTGRWAWQAGPACSCQCNGDHAQEAPGRGPGFAGPAKTKATSRGPGWTGPAVAVGNGNAFFKALQRRAAKGRPCCWRGGCRRRACRRLTRTRCRSARSSRKSHDKVNTKSNGRFQTEGPGQDSVDFSGASKKRLGTASPRPKQTILPLSGLRGGPGLAANTGKNPRRCELATLSDYPLLPERITVVASGTRAWLDRLQTGGLAGRPRWKECQPLWQPLTHPWQNQGFFTFAWTLEQVPTQIPVIHNSPCPLERAVEIPRSGVRVPGGPLKLAPVGSELRTPVVSELRTPVGSELRAPVSSELRTPVRSELRTPVRSGRAPVRSGLTPVSSE
eukprot:5814362-Amphidinium_carterae.1